MSAAAEEVASELMQADDLAAVNQAVAKIDKVSAGIGALTTRFKGVIFDVTTVAGMDGAKEARREIRDVRIDIEKVRITAKRKIMAVGKDLDTRAGTITASLEALEDPIAAQIKVEEDRKEAIKAAKLEAERKRIEALQARIAAMASCVAEVAGKSAAVIAAAIDKVEAVDVTEEEFAEWAPNARSMREQTLERLRAMHTEREAFEVEQARMEQERQQREIEAEAERKRQANLQADLDRQRKEQQDREAEHARKVEAERIETARLAQIEADKLQAERDEQERLAEVERFKAAEVQRAIAEVNAAEATRLANIKREQEETAAAEQRRQQAEQRRLDDERARNTAAASITETMARGLTADNITDAQLAVAALEAIVIDEDTVGIWSDELADQRIAAISQISNRIRQLDQMQRERLQIEADRLAALNPPPAPDPTPAVAEQVTATTSTEDAGSAPAPEAFEEPEYPGDEAIEQAIAAQFAQTHLVARIWLRRYSDQVQG